MEEERRKNEGAEHSKQTGRKSPTMSTTSQDPVHDLISSHIVVHLHSLSKYISHLYPSTNPKPTPGGKAAKSNQQHPVLAC